MSFTYLLATIYFLLLVEVGSAKFTTTSANFLKIGVGSRISAMANAGSFPAQDANLLYWNPSALAFLNKPNLQTTYLSQLDEIHFSHIGFAQPFKGGSLGFSSTILFTTEIEGRDELNLPTANFSFYNWSFATGYAKMVSKNSSAGFSMKIIREAVGHDHSDGIAFDFGWMGRKKGWIDPENLTYFAVVFQNIGPDLGPGKSSPLPLNGRLGISSSPLSKKWMMAIDVVAPFRDEIELNFGNEWQAYPNFFFRAGYRFFRGGLQNEDWFKSLTGGFGFYFTPPSGRARYNLDYAISTFGMMGLNHSLSFGVQFLK